jgi:Domain of unknown function (DUF4279)
MDRSYAYLRVVGQSSVAGVTDAFGIQPAKSWNVGDKRRNGSVYDFSHWQTTEFDGQTLDAAVRALVGFIEESRLEFSRLPNGFVATIQCVGHHEDQSPGFHFEADLARRLGRMGLAIDFDLYCHAKP